MCGRWSILPAKDVFHQAVRHALEKDGWTITHDPLLINLQDEIRAFIDLGAERLIGAQRAQETIAVEVKNLSAVHPYPNFIPL